MSSKFEKLLDYVVNEEHEKAAELFHEIVVEKSRTIYENLLAEEVEDEAVDEAEDLEDEAVDEAEELEDSYDMMDDEEADHGFEPGDATDDLGADVMMPHDNGDDMGGEHVSKDQAIFDIKSAIEELEAAFALDGGMDGMDHMSADDEFDDEEDDEFDDEEGDEEVEEMIGIGKNRRMTREYVEKVGHDWDKGSTQKKDGDYVGGNTGEKMPSPKEGKSPVSSGKGKPTTGASAGNIAQGGKGDSQDGTKPSGKAGGLSPEKSGQFTGKDWENNSMPGGKAGVKNLKNVNHDYAKKGTQKTPGPVGSGTGEKAGQTSVSSDKPFLKKL